MPWLCVADLPFAAKLPHSGLRSYTKHIHSHMFRDEGIGFLLMLLENTCDDLFDQEIEGGLFDCDYFHFVLCLKVGRYPYRRTALFQIVHPEFLYPAGDPVQIGMYGVVNNDDLYA